MQHKPLPLFGPPYIRLREANFHKLTGVVLPKLSDNALLRTLCNVVLNNDDFLTFPASVGKHHFWNGGLVDHTIEVIEYVVAQAVPQGLDVGVLTTAALWHDFAKIRDYAPTPQGWITTPHYKRIRHVVGGVLEFDRAYRMLENEDTCETYERIVHMMLSHHGRLEWGSPVLPHTPEAVLLHQADYFSAQGHCSSYVHDRDIGCSSHDPEAHSPSPRD